MRSLFHASLGFSFVVSALALGAIADPPRAVVEQEVTIGKEPFRLGATLCKPGGKGPFPAMLLIHGSHALDRNASDMIAKKGSGIFKDLAEGLAAQGFAVLRYDKRSHAYPDKRKPGEWTLEDEVMEDALVALDCLRANPAVDRQRLFIVGWSLGGMLAPAIAERAGDAAGLVILAGPCRPIELVMDDQLEDRAKDPKDIFNLLGFRGRMMYRAERQTLDRLKAGKSLPDDLLWERSPVYWQSVNKNAPASRRKGLNRPVLVMQGDNDKQVGAKDIEAWRKLLKDGREVVFRAYPKLDHSFRRDDDANEKGPAMSAEVVKDIGDWARTLGR